MKRYAIVRIDEGCPLSDINIGNINACKASKGCHHCLFGDTKEQLINKVAQVIKRTRYAIEMGEVCKIADDEGLAKEIVEFLGVKE